LYHGEGKHYGSKDNSTYIGTFENGLASGEGERIYGKMNTKKKEYIKKVSLSKELENSRLTDFVG